MTNSDNINSNKYICIYIPSEKKVRALSFQTVYTNIYILLEAVQNMDIYKYTPFSKYSVNICKFCFYYCVKRRRLIFLCDIKRTQTAGVDRV
jgi:hypothetical protein